ncbi:MAG: hypothetical protein OXH47_10145 [Paracoccaceae bacterium]|nr:hypothetical protein [Paracoccaceae bacterium]
MPTTMDDHHVIGPLGSGLPQAFWLARAGDYKGKSVSWYFAFAMIIGLLTGCGGGGGVITSSPVPPDNIPTSSVGSSNNIPYPVFHRANTFHVGTSAAPPVVGLNNTGSRNGVSLYKGSRTDGTSEDDILKMFEDITNDGNTIFPVTFRTRPIVRVVGSDALFRETVFEAVSIINSVLPWDRRMKFDDTPVSSPDSLSDIPVDHIYVEYSNTNSWKRIYKYATPSHGLSFRRKPTDDIDAPTNYVLAGWVGVNSISQVLPGNQDFVRKIIVHELLHNLGFWGHTDSTDFPDSIQNPNANYDGSGKNFVLSPQDKDMIHAAYTRIQPGMTRVEDITSLGQWTSTTLHLMGTFGIEQGEVTFGVSTRNGLVQPWAEGPSPTGTIASASFVNEKAHWNGVFLGYARSDQEVIGDVRLDVHLSNLSSGDLTFSDLKLDDGQSWNDDDLAYKVDIKSNTFVNHERTGSDAGTITGVFLGSNYEGMAGILRREDISGAFGGKQ